MDKKDIIQLFSDFIKKIQEINLEKYSLLKNKRKELEINKIKSLKLQIEEKLKND